MRLRLRTSVRAVVAILALLATVLRLSMAAVMPLPMLPVAADDYARFVAEFGTDAFLCAAMPGTADRRAPSGDRPAPGQIPDCAVCPLCTSLRDAATDILPMPAPELPAPLQLAALDAPRPADDLLPRRPIAPALARAPPTTA